MVASLGSGGANDFSAATEDYVVNLLAGADASTGSSFTVLSGSATARTITFQATGANRHTGVRGTGYRMAAGIVDIQIFNTSVAVATAGISAQNFFFDSSSAGSVFTHDALLGYDINGSDGIRFAGGTHTIRNSAYIGALGTRPGFRTVANGSTPTATAINCDAVACTGNGFEMFAGTFTVKNCYSGGNSSAGFSGCTIPTAGNCKSSDGSQSTGTVAYTTANFTNVTAGSEDLKLPSGSSLIAAGTGPSSDAAVPTVDFEGTARSGATTDIGFDQRTAAGGASARPNLLLLGVG